MESDKWLHHKISERHTNATIIKIWNFLTFSFTSKLTICFIKVFFSWYFTISLLWNLVSNRWTSAVKHAYNGVPGTDDFASL